MSQENKTKEVDLFDLFASIGNGIKNLVINIFDGAMWLLFFGIKRYKILLIFIAFGLALGIYKTYSGRQSYTSGMLIRTNAISSFELKAILDEFSNYFSSGNEISNKRIQKYLDLDSAHFSNISGVNAHFVIDVYLDGTIDYYDLRDNSDPRDTIRARSEDYLYIQAGVYDPSVLPMLQEGLINYISSNHMVMASNEVRLSQKREVIKSCELETLYLDSLQKATYFSVSQPQLKYTSNQLILGESRKQLVHYDKFNIVNAKQKVAKEVDLYSSPITVISDFPLAAQKMSTPIGLIIVSVIKLTFLGYVVLLVIYFLRKVSGNYMAKV